MSSQAVVRDGLRGQPLSIAGLANRQAVGIYSDCHQDPKRLADVLAPWARPVHGSERRARCLDTVLRAGRRSPASVHYFSQLADNLLAVFYFGESAQEVAMITRQLVQTREDLLLLFVADAFREVAIRKKLIPRS